jgi:hypothetical protein
MAGMEIRIVFLCYSNIYNCESLGKFRDKAIINTVIVQPEFDFHLGVDRRQVEILKD